MCIYASMTISPLKVLYTRHDDVINWKHFPCNWPFVRGIHRSPVNSRHKGQWRGALMFPLIWAWINNWVNNRGAGDFRRHRAHYDAIVMRPFQFQFGFKHNWSYSCWYIDSTSIICYLLPAIKMESTIFRSYVRKLFSMPASKHYIMQNATKISTVLIIEK